MRTLVCVLACLLTSPIALADEAEDAAAIKAAFEHAKARDKADLARLAKAAAAKKATRQQIEQLRELRQAKVTKLDEVQWKKGGVGVLKDARFIRKLTADTVEIQISKLRYVVSDNEAVPAGTTNRSATLKGFDTSALAPFDPIREPVVILDSFDDTQAVYRVIDVAPYEAKYGRTK
jgi:hypothetical protein